MQKNSELTAFAPSFCFRKQGNILSLANTLAKLCHAIGKTVLKAWQEFANVLAKVCHTIGNRLAKDIAQ